MAFVRLLLLLLPLLGMSTANAPAPPVSKEATPAWKMFVQGWMEKLSGRTKATSDPVPMKVIGAGLGRTGSNSLMIALDQLGYKTYHMERAMENNHLPDWGRVMTPGHQDDKELDAVLDKIAAEGFTAGLDFPICSAYKELMKRWPDSPVILSTRSSPEVWAKSYYDTIFRLEHVILREQPPLTLMMPGFASASRWFTKRAMLPKHEDQTLESLAKGYVDWMEDVKRHVPREKLLIWKVQDGWAPLCSHLKIPKERCPSEEPFPRGKNDTADMQFGAAFLTIITDWFYMILAAALILVVVVIRFLLRCCCRTSKVKQG